MENQAINPQQQEQILNLCRQITRNREIVSACVFGARANGYGTEKSDVNVLLIVRNYPSRLMVYPKMLNAVNAFFLVVDSGLFEADIQQGIIGEFLAEKIMLPYQPLINPEYLQSQEVKLKKRVIWELLENLVLEYPEMSYEFVLKPKYFMYEDMARKARLFPLMTYTFLNTFRSDLRKRNIERMMKGYIIALGQLAEEGWITLAKGTIKINKTFIKRVNKRRIRLLTLFRTIQRGLLLYLLRTFPGVIHPTLEDQELYFKMHKQTTEERLVFQLDASQRFLLVPTPYGLVPFCDTTDIEDFVRKLAPSRGATKIELKRLGGVLNTVYLVSFDKNGQKQRIIVKKYKDWFAFKWFPLALWTLGTHSFAVLGQTRLEREYAINQFLSQNRFAVPKILHVSPQQRLIFKEYVEGTSMTKIVKRIINAETKNEKDMAIIRKIGEKLAKAHALGVALGDCKPENIVITKDGEPVFLDLEQATRNENQAWDIAEFLYYSGHYISPLANTNAAELITRAFIEGYLQGGGKKETIKKAWSAQYTKVFAIFTPPQVIFTISSICRKIGAPARR
ncbi:MAG: lipopolysaccharide kinase InaA family protein [Candidatus Bathyarchaeales archaeon]